MTRRGPLFSIRRFTPERIARFVEGQREAELAFREVGATRDGAACPEGFLVDRNETTLGRGRAAFEAARAAVDRFVMFDLGWVEACGPDLRVEVGAVVGVLARGPAMWVLNACRIVEVIDEDGGGRARHGFVYVTLPGHLERGEERFEVSLDADGTVRYRIVAVSQPAHLLARLGKPMVRREQKRFARASLARMERAVREADAVR